MPKFNIGDKVLYAPKGVISNERIFVIHENIERHGNFNVRLIGPEGKLLNHGDWPEADFQLKEAAVNLNKNGKARDAKGRFIKQADAPKKEKPKAKPVAKVEENALAKLQDVLRSELTQQVNGNAGTCSYALAYETWNVYQVRDACHASMKRAYKATSNIKAAALNVSGHLNVFKTKEDKTQYKEFVKWFINDSPWENTFLTKNVDEAFEKGILMDVFKPLSHVTCAAIALRSYSEFRGSVPVYQRMIKDGVPKAVAYILMMMCSGPKGDIYPLHASGSHTVVCGNHSVAGLKKFAKEGFHKLMDEEAFTSNMGGYSIFKSIADCSGYGQKELDDGFRKVVAAKVGKGWVPYTLQLSYYDLLRVADLLT